MTDAEIARVFREKFNGRKNVLTPDVIRYGKRGPYIYELSSGERMDGGRMYGVTVIELGVGLRHDLCRSFRQREIAEAFIRCYFVRFEVNEDMINEVSAAIMLAAGTRGDAEAQSVRAAVARSFGLNCSRQVLFTDAWDALYGEPATLDDLIALELVGLKSAAVASARRRMLAAEGTCKTCDQIRAGGGNQSAPPHDPSPNCKSGGYAHCSCDTCF